MAEQQLVEVAFKCPQCMRVLRVKVRARRTGEDIKRWVGITVGRAVAEAHQIASFGCTCMSVALALPGSPPEDPEPWIGKWNSVLPQVPTEDLFKKLEDK